MTATATPAPPVADEELEGLVPLKPRPEPSQIELTAGTTDHKVLGRLYIGAALGFGVLSFLSGILTSVERSSLETYEIFRQDVNLQVFSFHRLSLVVLVALPITIGLATAVVPLQLGAKTLAFPRAAATAFWGWLLGGLILLGSYLADGGPGGFRTEARALWVVAQILVVASLTLAFATLATTVIAARAPGLTLLRVPFFSWSVLVASTVWILSLPVLVANLLLGYATTRYGTSILGQEIIGGSEETWFVESWLWGRPQSLALLIVGLGVVSDIVVGLAGVPPRFRGVLFGAIAGFGVLSFGAWAQPVLYPFLVTDALYVGGAFLIGLPLLILVGSWADVIRRGSLKLTTPLAFAVVFLLLAAATVLVGALAVIDGFDLVGTSADSAQINFAAFAAVSAAIAGVFWWAPKLWGFALADGLGRLDAVVLLVATMAAAVPELISGFLDQPDPGSLADHFDTKVLAETGLDSAVEVLNLITVVGWALALLGVLLVWLALSRGRHAAAGADPWSGPTLEWSLPSPAPADNFDEVPTVTSAYPLLDGQDRRAEGDST